jgi:hypothetical protein
MRFLLAFKRQICIVLVFLWILHWKMENLGSVHMAQRSLEIVMVPNNSLRVIEEVFVDDFGRFDRLASDVLFSL